MNENKKDKDHIITFILATLFALPFIAGTGTFAIAWLFNKPQFVISWLFSGFWGFFGGILLIAAIGLFLNVLAWFGSTLYCKLLLIFYALCTVVCFVLGFIALEAAFAP